MGKTMAPAKLNSVRVQPIAGALGAEISGVDLSRPLDDTSFDAVRRALQDHLVIFFRDQTLDPGQYKAFASRFGPLCVHRYIKGMEGHPEVMEIVREPDDPKVFAEGWHADVTYQERPVLGSMLYAREVPAWGGDTLFANQYLAYETLSDGLRATLDDLRAVHGTEKVYGTGSNQYFRDGTLKVEKAEAATTVTEHPVVRTHPETGRKSLFVNDHYTLRFAGWSEAESRPLLDHLLNHAIRPEFTCRFRWTPNALAFWDNRCSLHSPLDDYFGKRRAMWRITVEGDRPV